MFRNAPGLLGVGFVAAFSWFVWQPAPLLVVGLALLAYDWMH